MMTVVSIQEFPGIEFVVRRQDEPTILCSLTGAVRNNREVAEGTSVEARPWCVPSCVHYSIQATLSMVCRSSAFLSWPTQCPLECTIRAQHHLPMSQLAGQIHCRLSPTFSLASWREQAFPQRPRHLSVWVVWFWWLTSSARSSSLAEVVLRSPRDKRRELLARLPYRTVR